MKRVAPPRPRRAPRDGCARPRGGRRAAALALTTLAVAGGGAAWASELPSQFSSNWAGWFVTAAGQGARLDRHFTTVTGSWVQPSAACVPGSRTFAAFWVGLGGYAVRSKALEQIGTEADCSSRGQLFYYAWYEYVPAPPVTIGRLKVMPGNVISATVHDSSDRVTVSIDDVTTAHSFETSREMRKPAPDTSAAEWIAEAPSNCNGDNHCKPLRLTDFGQITFTSASATAIGSAGLHSGPICDSAWHRYGMIVLQGGSASGGGSGDQQIIASPSPLSTNGTSFTVSYGPQGPTGPTESCVPSSGPTGGTGATGPSGPSGASGASGATGATAATGASGATT